MPFQHKTKIFYVTGTDTDVGKTIVSAALLKALNNIPCSTMAVKPIASGCDTVNGKLLNQDALLLQSNASQYLDYDLVNPYAFKPAIAPHIAAKEKHVELSADLLATHVKKVCDKGADVTLVEGAGGWYVPLGEAETLADFAEVIDANVILVVAIRLGCINHALLSVQAIKKQGLNLAGWVANFPNEPINEQQNNRDQENIETLRQMIKPPLLATVPWIKPSMISKAESDMEKCQHAINKASECFKKSDLIKIIKMEAA